MINLESIRSMIRNPSFYGVALSFIGAAGIFTYSVYNGANKLHEKEDGTQFVTLQLTAFAPPSLDKIAEEIQKPRKHHHKKHHHKKKHELESPPQEVETAYHAKKEESKPEPPEPKVEPKEEETPKVAESKDDTRDVKEADVATTVESSKDANSTQNIKTLRASDGVDNAFLRAIREAIAKRHDYPNLARQRGYEIQQSSH